MGLWWPGLSGQWRWLVGWRVVGVGGRGAGGERGGAGCPARTRVDRDGRLTI